MDIHKISNVTGKAVKIGAVFFLASKLMACTPQIRTETPIISPPGITETVVVPTFTQEPTQTATPEIAQPSVPNGLRSENAATQTLENGSWIVKNANGEITSTWNEQTKEWTYNTENIKIYHAIIGFDGQDPHLLDPLFEGLPADTPEMHYTDPKTGNPLPYGFVREDVEIIDISSSEHYELPLAMFAARVLGVVSVGDKYVAIALEIPVSPDQSAIITMRNLEEVQMSLRKLTDDDLAKETLFYLSGPDLSRTERLAYLKELRGKQVLMGIFHDIPSSFITAMGRGVWDVNDDCKALLQYLTDPSNSAPRFKFIHFDKMSPYLENQLWVPFP